MKKSKPSNLTQEQKEEFLKKHREYWQSLEEIVIYINNGTYKLSDFEGYIDEEAWLDLQLAYELHHEREKNKFIN